MAHRTRTVNAAMTALGLVLAAATALVALLAGQSPPGPEALPGAVGALVGGLAAALATGAGRLPEPGMVLATEAQTRRAVGRRLWLYVPLLAAVTVGLALLNLVWIVPAFSLVLALSGAITTAHVARWERRHPDVLIAQHLGWVNERRLRWSRAWGDRAPDDLTPETIGATLPPTWLQAVGFWPSKNPDDYR
jgi:hypothetical protein